MGEKNQFLDVGMFLQSKNACFQLVMQDDGNLVLYNIKTGSVVWATGTDRSVNQCQGEIAFFNLKKMLAKINLRCH